MAKVTKIGVETRMFHGLSRVILFPGFDLGTLTDATSLADILANGKDLGQIVDGSPSWDGEDIETTVLKNTEGGAIITVPKPGTCAWSCSIPHSKETALIVGGKEFTDVTSLGDGFTKGDGNVIGINPSAMTKSCPVGVLNLGRNELSLFPNASVGFTPSIGDEDLWVYKVSASANDVDTKNLATMMFIPLGADPLAETKEP